MINPHETKAFDLLYHFVHHHSGGVYRLTFENGSEMTAVYDTDYETDNGLEFEKDGYEEYIAILFKNIADNALFEVNCFNFPDKVLYNGEQII